MAAAPAPRGRGAVSRAEEWRRINELFHAALARPRTERATFLEAACADAPALRREIESLITAHEADPDFLEQGLDPLDLLGPSAQASDGASVDSPPLNTGSRLGRYVVEQELGRGGMGIVYLARDTELNRSVAIKLLPAALASDDRRRARLRREAQAAAALSHPGIATVYALEEVGRVLFIVSEYVRGRTLRDELEASGPFKGERLLHTALDIARALAAAHRQGVVHRDLKPENVVRSEHGIKIVDFGLAQLTPAEHAESVPTRLTRSGMILGTPAYMSPEQLRGEEADARCDQFMFGVLLYELITGQHPFRGPEVLAGRSLTAASPDAHLRAPKLDTNVSSFGVSTVPATWARILRDEPTPITAAGGTVAAQLEPVVARCLAKDPAERFSATDDLVSAILETRDAPAGGTRREGHAAERTEAPTSTPVAHQGATLERQAAPRLWWEVHQIVVSLVYGVMLWPMWLVRAHMETGAWRTLWFVANVAIVALAATLRLNLAFTSRCYPAALDLQRRRVSWLVRAADWATALLLIGGAAIVGGADLGLTALLVGVAIAAAAAFLFIEPTTTHAMLGERGPDL